MFSQLSILIIFVRLIILHRLETIHFVIQYTVYSAAELWPTVYDTALPSLQIVFAQPPGHMMRRLSACGGGFTLSHKALQAFAVSACFFCTLYKYVI